MTPEIIKFAELSKTKKQLKGDLDAVDKELENLQEIVMTQFQQSETQSMNIQGLTLYIGSQLWAKKATENITSDDMIRVLDEAHLGEYADRRVNVQGLSAYFRRCEELKEPVPECFKNIINVERTYEIKTRSAS